jgi:hypothetical protein
MKARKPNKTRADSVVYKQGAQTIYLEPVQDTFATRYRDDAEQAVNQALHRLGQVETSTAQRLIIVKLLDSQQTSDALQLLRQWLDEGMVEFVTPVLREMDSQLLQVLTDEITIRFKAEPSASCLHDIEQKYAVSVARQNEFVPDQFIMKVVRPFGLRTLEVARDLADVSEVRFATPNFISRHGR